MFSKVFFLALLPSIFAVNHAVSVGANNALAFSPTTITAAVGDTITFTVVSRNHSISSAQFSGAICPPPAGGAGFGPFDSGFLSNLDGSLPTFVYTVVDTQPRFGACRQANGGHCRAGMTFAINPDASHTYADFLANARAS
ncbi:hypothetical protein B0H15DRAFT_954786 [Mycena belliarum]|uniref:Uncharacterized protein n=1 Tax=Mycena belliarum TaxID=1033014 RepID=A0AAD6XL94_9AGAR|nr:hypothetical protein B0H15DRAFT_954786 [Mycena belliae]